MWLAGTEQRPECPKRGKPWALLNRPLLAGGIALFSLFGTASAQTPKGETANFDSVWRAQPPLPDTSDPLIQMRVLRQAANEAGKNGRKEEAAKLFDRAVEAARMEPWQQVWHLNYLMEDETSAGFFDQAERLMSTLKPGERDQPVYQLVEAEAKAGMFERAKRLVDSMSVLEWMPTTLAGVGVWEAKAGRVEEARKTIQQAVRMAMKGNGKGTYTAVLDESMKALVLSDIALAEAGLGWKEEARRLFERVTGIMVRDRKWRDAHPDPEASEANPSLWGMISLAEQQAQAGFFEMAKRTARRTENADVCSSAMASIAEEEVKQGLLEQARKTIRHVRDSSERAEALTHIAVEEAKAGRGEEAEKTFAEAEGLADGFSGVIDEIALCRAKVGFFEKALVIVLREYNNNDIIRWAMLSRLAETETGIGQYEQAKIAVRKINPNSYDRALGLVKIAVAEAGAGRRPEAEQTFEEAWRAAMELDTKFRTEVQEDIRNARREASRAR